MEVQYDDEGLGMFSESAIEEFSSSIECIDPDGFEVEVDKEVRDEDHALLQKEQDFFD